MDIPISKLVEHGGSYYVLYLHCSRVGKVRDIISFRPTALKRSPRCSFGAPNPACPPPREAEGSRARPQGKGLQPHRAREGRRERGLGAGQGGCSWAQDKGAGRRTRGGRGINQNRTRPAPPKHMRRPNVNPARLHPAASAFVGSPRHMHSASGIQVGSLRHAYVHSASGI